MKRLMVIVLLFAAASALAAGKQYYDFPDAETFHDADRMLIYSNHTSKNLTGAGLKSIISQTAWDPNGPRVFQVNSSASTAPNAGLKIASITRNRRGIVTAINYENGGRGQGVPYFNHRYVYPFNGMTNVRRDTPLVVGTVWQTRGMIVTPNISIQGGPALTIQGLYYAGLVSGLPNFGVLDESADQSMVDAFYWGTPSVGMLAANTTYTIRSAIATAWGGEDNYQAYDAPSFGNLWGGNPCRFVFATYSSGALMSNYSTTVCRSTFRTGAN